LIAGEALMGLVTSGYILITKGSLPQLFRDPSYAIGIAVMALLGVILVRTSISNAGRPEDPAPPVAMM
jgi:hypothetical protein